MSLVKNLRSPSPPPALPQSPVADAEPPRKRRRKGLAINQAGYMKPENRNADLFTKADYVIEGPYRRVPPYYYVLHLLLFTLTLDVLYMGQTAMVRCSSVRVVLF